MYANLHARFVTIGEEDSDREDDLGHRCPTSLRIILANGDHLDCQLVDGINSVDDQTLDVDQIGEANPEGAGVWIVSLSHIAAVHLRYPLDSEIEAAREKAAAGRRAAA